jgi:hypothetical protein
MLKLMETFLRHSGLIWYQSGKKLKGRGFMSTANFETELATYASKLPELQAESGKFVLIKGDNVEGVFDTYADALNFGYQKFKLEKFLVKQIGPAENIHFFSRDLVCH